MKKFLKNYLPESFVIYLARLLDNLKYLKKKLLNKNPIFLSLSICFNSNYIREHKAFLEGALIYERSLKQSKTNIYYIRRNIHRLEKAMLMKPRREEFGLRFILGTVKAFRSLMYDMAEVKNVKSELQWSYDVLSEYFKIVKSKNKEFLQARNIFIECEDLYRKKGISETKKIPYLNKRQEIIPYDELLMLSSYRKSVRWFKENKAVNKKDIEKALKIALLSPSSCNRQPFKYYISTDRIMAQKIARIPAGTVGWYDNVPAIAVLVGRQRAFPNILNRHSIYVDSTLSVMPFIYALETLGLSSCIINWADDRNKEKEMAKILNLGNDEKVVLSIAIGHADNEREVAYSKRKDIEEIVEYL